MTIFNTPKTIATLFGMSAHINTYADGGKTVSDISKSTFQKLVKTYSEFVEEVLGLELEEEGQSNALDDVMNILINIRNDARSNKDWSTSDKIRDQLNAAQILIKDGKDGTTSYEIG